MKKTRLRVPLGLWDGGLNEDESPLAVAANELRLANNVYWQGRALSSRPGATRLQTSAINSGAAVTGIWQLERLQGTVRDAIATVGNKLYKDATTTAPVDITGTITITATHLTNFTNFNDLALMCNGTDAPWKWSGSGNAAVLGGSPPLFNTMLAKWARMFGGGQASAPRTVRFSALGDPETWNAANTVAAIVGDSSSAIEGRDFIYQLGHLGDSMFVGLQNSIGRILYTGDSTTPFRYNQLSEFGVEGQTYVAVGNGGYFLSRRGVHFIRPSDILITYESSLITGRKLRTSWQSLNKNRIKESRPTLYYTRSGNLLVLWPLSTGSGPTHDAVLMMDVTEGPGKERFAWWYGWDTNVVGMVVHTSTLAERLVFGSPTGFVWHGDDGSNSDNGAAYTCEAATRWEDFGSPAEKKNLREMYMESSLSSANALNIDTYFDYNTTAVTTVAASVSGSAQAVWGTGVWGTDLWPTRGISREHLYATDDGVVVSFRFYSTTADTPWVIYKFVPAVEAIGEAKES